MATVLDKQIKRQVTVDDVDYTVAVDPEGLRLMGKGKMRDGARRACPYMPTPDPRTALALMGRSSHKGVAL